MDASSGSLCRRDKLSRAPIRILAAATPPQWKGRGGEKCYSPGRVVVLQTEHLFMKQGEAHLSLPPSPPPPHRLWLCEAQTAQQSAIGKSRTGRGTRECEERIGQSQLCTFGVGSILGPAWGDMGVRVYPLPPPQTLQGSPLEHELAWHLFAQSMWEDIRMETRHYTGNS